MKPRKFVIADTHFGHKNILTFKREDGTLLRDFPSVEAMDEHMIAQWNRVVRPEDKVYHLGDVVINRRCLPTLARLNGHKRLVRGNHDIFRTADFLPYFEEIYGVRVFPDTGVILSHIPIHPDSMERWRYNVHGHLHSNKVMLKRGRKTPDLRYICVSVEQINYTPVELEELLANR